jgi:NAD-dependent deacetylase
MATRHMYQHKPVEFLSWYYHRFATYRHHGPNRVHYWLADKNVITQNVDGLDGKAGNKNYIAVHGRLDKMTLFVDEINSEKTVIYPALWDDVDEEDITGSLLSIFRIHKKSEYNHSYKPYVLLFDEYYSELYRITKAKQRMMATKRIVFIGTSLVSILHKCR